MSYPKSKGNKFGKMLIVRSVKVKSAAFMLCFLFMSNLIFGQIRGDFQFQERSEFIQVTITDTGFVKMTSFILNHGGFYTKGHFKTKGDTLILIGEPYKGMTSYFEIIDQTDSSELFGGIQGKLDSSYVSLNIKIVDEEDRPVPLSLVALFDKESENIATVLSDDDGKFFLSTWNKTINKILIGTIGFRSLEIPLKSFRGFSSELRVHLKTEDLNTYNEHEFEEKYLINSARTTLTQIRNDSLGMTLRLKK